MERGLIIGFSNVDGALSFQKRVIQAAKTRAEEMDAALIVLDAKGSLEQEKKNIALLIEKGAAAVMVAAVDYYASAAACREAEAAGKAVVTVADPAEGMRYVGSDRIDGGGALPAAEYMARKLNGRGDVIYIRGDEGITRTFRDEGFGRVIRAYPEIHVVFEKQGEWDFESGHDIMREAIQKHPAGKVGAVFAQNDDMALGAVHAMMQAGWGEETFVFGIDGAPPFLDAIAAGHATMTAFQNAERIGMIGVETAYAVSLGRQASDHIPIGWETVDAQNVQKYRKRWDEARGIFNPAGE